MGEESDYLNDLDISDDIQEEYYKDINKKIKRYNDNKQSQIKTTIRCANCGKRIIKKSYQTQFCSNKGKRNCKDTYWNNTDDKRRQRAIQFNH